jgi:alpha-tubulin suppressor-like RCC1 family protein
VRRAGVVVLLAVSCGHGKAAPEESIAVAPKPVVAKPIEVVGEGSPSFADVAPFELAIGNNGFCVRLEGKVHCGPGEDSRPLATLPPVGGIDDATSVALGSDFGCLTTRRGTVHCWGSNSRAQLGAMLASERSEDAVQVAHVEKAKRVFAGDEHACAITEGGGLWCWGLNLSGETGGSTSWAPPARELATPNEVPLRNVTAVAMTYRSTCAVSKGGRLDCWGASFLPDQQQAQGHTNEKPFAVAALKDLEDISAASGAFCGVRAGEVVCAGSTYALVSPDPNRDREKPTKVNGLKGIAKVRVGGSHACALARDGRVLCWGYDSNGELGRDEPHDPNASYEAQPPGPVPGIANARDIAVWRFTSCAITGPEEAWCWGPWPVGPRGLSGLQHQSHGPARLRIR